MEHVREILSSGALAVLHDILDIRHRVLVATDVLLVQLQHAKRHRRSSAERR